MTWHHNRGSDTEATPEDDRTEMNGNEGFICDSGSVFFISFIYYFRSGLYDVLENCFLNFFFS
jgi:hypothetical protein